MIPNKTHLDMCVPNVAEKSIGNQAKGQRKFLHESNKIIQFECNKSKL
jgi:hypothetical protein